MNAASGLVLIVSLIEICSGLGKKSASINLPWPGYPFQRPPEGYFPALPQEDVYYYEAYDLGEADDLTAPTGFKQRFDARHISINKTSFSKAPNPKPDRRVSSAFKVDVSRSLHDFTFDLYSTMVQNKSSENVVISPLSIYTAMSMLTLGLGGNSRSQALKVMHGEIINDIHVSMEQLSQALFEENRENVTLTAANRIFVDRSIQLLKPFKRQLRSEYHASAKKVNFLRQPELNRRRINGFVQRHTNKKIKNLAPPGSITRDTRLFIANAMYLKAYWKTPFSSSSKRTFRVTSDEVISTQTMTSMGACTHITDDDLRATVVRNPMKGSLSMIMIVPNAAGDFSRIEDTNGKQRVRRALEKIYETDDDWMSFCQLSMPKFKIDYTVQNLVRDLKKMGMKDVFDSSAADLTRMTSSDKNLYVSDFRHKASIEVNEKGVEGAAATSVVASQRMMPWPVPVDRPFMFILRDDKTGATLFAGKVVRPDID